MPKQKYKERFVEDSDCFIKEEINIQKLISKNLTLKEVIKFIQEAGVYELYQIEAEAKLEFKRRGYKLQ
jgi:hypothetical protein